MSEYPESIDIAYNEPEENDIIYEDDNGNRFFVAMRIRNYADPYYGVMCQKADTLRTYWLQTPRRHCRAAATDDLVRLALKSKDWGEVIA